MHGLSLGAHFTDSHFSWGRPGNSHHSHHTHHTEGTGHHRQHAANQVQDTSSVGSDAAQGTVKQAVVNQIRATLTQRFELHMSSVAVAGATADEQASNDLAGVVSSALNSLSGTPPSDAVAAVNDAATNAVQQTSQALTPSDGSGAPAGLDAAVSQINDQLQSLFSAFLANADATQGSGVTATGAKLISNAKGVLEIHTQEGDTVTLSFASKSGVSVQNYQAGNANAQITGSDLQAFSRSRVTVNVQGDLNSDELQAVQDLVDKVNRLADGFFSGDVNAVLSQAGGLNFDNSQLADFSLHVALKQTFEAYGLKLNIPPAVAAAPLPTPDNTGTTGSTSESSPTGPVDPNAPLTVTASDVSPSGNTSTTSVDPAAADKTVIAGQA